MPADGRSSTWIGHVSRMEDSLLTVAVVGLGYIGLPTAAVLAARGARVFGVDVNRATVATVNSGRVPFVEPDLRETLARAVHEGLLSAHEDMPHAEIYVVAVPTPFTAGHHADVSYIRAAVGAIARVLRGGELIILESTSPPGTTEQIAGWVREDRPDLIEGAVEYAHCPERVLPGRVMIELVENDRIIGGLTPTASERAAAMYRTFCRGRLILTDARTAELAKLVENSYRDVNIAFANELSLICEALGVDVWELIELANHHPRVDILQPGPGVGGHCIAVDPWFIVSAAPEQARLIRTAREVNDAKPLSVIDAIIRAVTQGPSQTVALLGLAFKKNIDDLRESPALRIAEDLVSALPGVQLLIVEPHVEVLPESLAGSAHVRRETLERAVAEAGVVVVLVDHDHFLSVRPEQLAGKAVIDTRGLWATR